jgi:hypothetical protein
MIHIVISALMMLGKSCSANGIDRHSDRSDLPDSGISSSEVFGVFSRLIASNFLFALLGNVLVASLFIQRLWCSCLRPLRPVTDLIRLMRDWIRELWKNVRTSWN